MKILNRRYAAAVLAALVLAAVILAGAFPASAAPLNTEDPDLGLDCVSAILMEADTGTVLYEMNADEALPPASVTKVMTLLLVMEAIDRGVMDYDTVLTTSTRASKMGGSQIYLKEGEQMKVNDLIKSVVISSANDAAVVLAEAVAGSEEAFVAAMNKRATELGMKTAHFENTNGLDDTVTNHVLSARDIAIMSRELMKHKKILEFSSTWMDTVRDGAFGLTNTNRLIRFYRGATGLKTGSTSKAKFCMSATAERDGMPLIAVIMAAPTRDGSQFGSRRTARLGLCQLCRLPLCGGRRCRASRHRRCVRCPAHRSRRIYVGREKRRGGKGHGSTVTSRKGLGSRKGGRRRRRYRLHARRHAARQGRRHRRAPGG